MRKIGKIVRFGKEIEVNVLSQSDLIANDQKYYSLGFAKKGVIYLTDNYAKLTPNTRKILLEHEVAHALGINNEVDADKRAILCYNEEMFKEAVKESYAYMNQYAKKDEAYIEQIVNKRICLAVS